MSCLMAHLSCAIFETGRDAVDMWESQRGVRIELSIGAMPMERSVLMRGSRLCMIACQRQRPGGENAAEQRGLDRVRDS